MSCAIAMVGLFLVALAPPAEKRAEALRMLQAERNAIRTGTLRWSRCDYRKGGATRASYESRIAGGDLVLRVLGDGGAVERDPSNPRPPPDHGPLNVLNRDGECWTHEELSVFAEVWPTGHGFSGTPDPRTFGLATVVSFETLDQTVWLGASDGERVSPCEEFDEHGMTIVKARDGNDEVSYVIDPARGWNPVRITRRANGLVTQEMRCELAEFDGHWFPRRIEYFDADFENGSRPAEIVEVEHAAFNRPGDPARLGPGDIRIDIGTNIHRFNSETQEHELTFWDGEKLISQDEYLRRAAAGELRAGEMFRAADAHNRAAMEAMVDQGLRPYGWYFAGRSTGGATFRNFESQWEAYTRRFISRYSLTEDQTQQALAVLAECQARANAYLASHRREIEELDGQLGANGRASASAPAERHLALRERARALIRPIDDLTRELHDRLDRIPTRSQRAAHPTSRPTVLPRDGG
jgi:hypothetical protein